MLKFPALMTKVKALYSKMLSKEDFENLINTSSVTEITEYLKTHTHYSETFKNIDVSQLHRRDVEILIRRSMLDDFYNIYFYLPTDGKKFFKFMEKRFEIENIKFVLRSLHSGHPEYIEKRKLFPLNHRTVDEDSLVSVKSFEDILNVFRGTEYQKILESSYQSYAKTQKIQHLLNSLDFWYFTTMKKTLDSMPGYSKGLKELFYKQVDLTNIQWIYRARILFKLSTGEVLNFLIPFRRNLTKEDLQELASSNTATDFIGKLSSHPYGKYFKGIDENMFPYVIERACEKALLDDSKRLISMIQNGFDVMVGYIHIREFEYRDLITLIEAKRYSLSNEKMANYLISLGG